MNSQAITFHGRSSTGLLCGGTLQAASANTGKDGMAIADNRASKAGVIQLVVAPVVQRVIINNGDGEEITDYDLDNLDYYTAEFLDTQINQLRVWHADPGDLAKIAVVLAQGPPQAFAASSKPGKAAAKPARSAAAKEEVFVAKTPAEAEKERQIQPYLDLIDHLAGEGGGKIVLTGGHLLSEMKKKYKNLVISGEPDANAPWEGWWSDGAAAPKWSSFFPASWERGDLVSGLRKSAAIKGGRELPGGITISKTGDTFYPWVNQTLPAPTLAEMVPPP